MSAVPATAAPPAAPAAQGLAAPALIVAILAMMILPLPPLLLDLLFTFNIALAMLVLFSGIQARRPLDLLAFPTILLVTTLLRLSLNVASTRVVLLEGHKGPAAAGKVIEAFGSFLVGGHFAVGIVVFVILTLINFVVITKGAGRIAEVAARFTLDAMPGKQMAIDADLNAGLIGEPEARRRRSEVAQEAEFFGAMDGASKFVRGDAIAGILVLLVNIVGGLAIGMIEHDLPFAQAASSYVVLAIGDGLVAQVPALIISTAAGLVVSRVGSGEDMGRQVVSGLFRSPRALALTAGILCLIGLVPGMPHFAFLALAAVFGLGARALGAAARRAGQAHEAVPAAAAAAPRDEASWDDLQPVDPLGLELGLRLVPLADRGSDGELLRRMKAIRRRFAQEVGFLPPAVHVRDNLELRPNAYRITLRGVTVAEGELQPGRWLAINPGGATGSLMGIATTDPAFGLPATWVDAQGREAAQAQGYTVVDPASVAATHFNHVLQSNAARLLGRAETQGLLDHFSRSTPRLVEELVPKVLSLATVQRVLQNLLEDAVGLRDLRGILEALAEAGGRTQDPAELTTAVRLALAPALAQTAFGGGSEAGVLMLDHELERVLLAAAGTGEALGLEPGLADTLARQLGEAARRHDALGQSAALVVPDRLRPALARLARRAAPQLKVLGHGEIPESRTLRVHDVIGARP